MDPETLDKILTVTRKHQVRAFSLNPATGELRVEFAPSEVDEILDISPAVAGAWKKRAQDAETFPYAAEER